MTYNNAAILKQQLKSFKKQLHKLFGDKPIPHATLTCGDGMYILKWHNKVSQLEVIFTERDDIEHILRYTHYEQPERSFSDHTFSAYTVWKILNKQLNK